jgi:hypothetical protein
MRQVFAYFLLASASAAALFRWRKLAGLVRYWNLYGWFCGLSLVGSCCGIVSWLAWMQRLVFNYKDNFSPQPLSNRGVLLSQAYRSFAAFSIFYPMEFMCLSIAQLLVLDRMYQFVTLAGHGVVIRIRLWSLARRVVICATVAGNVAGVCGNIAAAVFHSRSADLFSASSVVAAASVNITADAVSLFQQGRVQNQLAISVGSVQSFCEVIALLLIVASYFVVSTACGQCIRNMMSTVRSTTSTPTELSVLAEKLQNRIIFSTVTVFVAFIIRSVFSTMHAVSDRLQDWDKVCGNVISLCNECYNVYSHIAYWMYLTPQFQLTIVLISSPVSLFVALWGMTPPAAFSTAIATVKDDADAGRKRSLLITLPA